MAISFCADVCIKFRAHLLREVPLPLPLGLFGSVEPSRVDDDNTVGFNHSQLQRRRQMQSHWHPPCEDRILAKTVIIQS